MSLSKITQHQVTQDQDNSRLDRLLKTHYPEIPLSRLQKALRKGEIRVDLQKATANQRLSVGQIVKLPPINPTPQQQAAKTVSYKPRKVDYALAQDLKSAILYDDPEIIVLNKPQGLAVQGGTNLKRHIDGALPALIEQSRHYQPGQKGCLVHRLDKDTSGILLIAKSQQVARQCASAFRTREFEKQYWAICIGVPHLKQGTIQLRIAKLADNYGVEKMRVDDEHGQYAHTDYEILDYAGKRLSLVALYPRTGRTHQLRVHMAAIDHPLLGDFKYGGKSAQLEEESFDHNAYHGDFYGDDPYGEPNTGASDNLAKLHLHAHQLTIPASLGLISAGMRFTAPPTAGFLESLAHFGLKTK